MQARTEFEESSVQKTDAVRSSDLKAPQARMLGAGILRGGTKGSPRSCSSSRLDLNFWLKQVDFISMPGPRSRTTTQLR